MKDYGIILIFIGMILVVPISIGFMFENHSKDCLQSYANEYCEKNKIKLIRIPYWDFNNIEEILTKELMG